MSDIFLVVRLWSSNRGTRAGKRTERFGKPTTYDRQLHAFVALVRAGTPVPTDAWDGVRNMQVIDDIYRAAGMDPRSKEPEFNNLPIYLSSEGFSLAKSFYLVLLGMGFYRIHAIS